MKIPAKFFHVGFLDLLCDALYHYRLASNSTDSYAINRNARASILASALSIECSANALIQDLDISTDMLSDLDRLPAISKFETYLLIKNVKKSIARGDNKVQKIKELIQVRNQFVHPKGTKIKTEIGRPQDGRDQLVLPMELEGIQHKELKIPKSSMFWSAESAISVLHAIFDFYSYYFEGILDWNSEKDSVVLLNRVSFKNIIVPNLSSDFEQELLKAKELKLKTSFLNIS